MDVIHSFLSEKYVEDFVNKLYDLGGIREIRLYHTGINDFYRIKSESETYYFRISSAQRIYENKLEYYEAEVKLILFLMEKGIKTTIPVKTLTGNYINCIESIEGDRFTLLTKGRTGKGNAWFDLDKDTWYDIGLLLAKLHEYMYEFYSNSKCERPNLKNLLFSQYKKSIPSFLSDDEVIKQFELKIPAILEAFDLLDEFSPKGLLHGDFGMGNILVQEHESKNSYVVFDFDYCTYGPQWFDLLGITGLMKYLDDDENSLCNSFLKGYQYKNKLPDIFFEKRKEWELLTTYNTLGIWSIKRDYFGKEYIGNQFTSFIRDFLEMTADE